MITQNKQQKRREVYLFSLLGFRGCFNRSLRIHEQQIM